MHFDRKSLFTSFGLHVWGVGMTWVSLNPLDFTADTFDLKKKSPCNGRCFHGRGALSLSLFSLMQRRLAAGHDGEQTPAKSPYTMLKFPQCLWY